jgi:hypothetical protein
LLRHQNQGFVSREQSNNPPITLMLDVVEGLVSDDARSSTKTQKAQE